MACERFAGAIGAHALGAPLDARATAHLAVCSDCQAALAREKHLLATIAVALDEVAAVTPAPDFVPRLRAHAEQTPRRRSRRWLVPAAAAALLAAVIVAVNRRQDPVPVSPAPEAAARGAATGAPASTSPLPPVTVARSDARPRRAAPPRTVAVSPASDASLVLVPEDQRRALGRLVAAAAAGRPEALSMLTATRATDAAIDVETPALIVPPLQIEPVVVSALVIAATPIEK